MRHLKSGFRLRYAITPATLWDTTPAPRCGTSNVPMNIHPSEEPPLFVFSASSIDVRTGQMKSAPRRRHYT